MSPDEVKLARFGFKFGVSGAHAARTMMFNEISTLLDLTNQTASKEAYRSAIVDANVLHKPTQKSRSLTYRHLVDLYALDPSIALFRIFRQLWLTDPEARPLLALTMAIARDPLLRLSRGLVLGKKAGEALPRQEMEEWLSRHVQASLSPASTKSFAQNINGSWTDAGYLRGRIRKIRSNPVFTATNVVFCLFLGHLEGLSGQRLFSSAWMQLIPTSVDDIEALAKSAASRGQIVLLSAGGVSEVRFPGYLNEQEEKWRHE